MAEGHGWGGASRVCSNHPAPASASATPPYPMRGAFSRTYVAVNNMQFSLGRGNAVATDAERPAQDAGVRFLFILLMFASVCSVALGGELVELKRSEDRIEVLVGGRPFTTYYFGPDAAKPYLFPLRSAQGTVVTRSFPMI